ncbi:MAG TPA: S8 family serine peptidase [Actinoplanes sp.]|nr:S8 family serine peptidase [Actinoplanes sp.]
MTVAGVGNATGAAAAPVEPRFDAVPAGSKITNLPAGMRDRQVTVMVQLSEEPVAVVDAAAAEPLTTAQKKQRRERIRSEQAPVEKKARQLGGTVLGAYQDAYNGIKIRVAADELESLAAAPGVVKVHALQLVKPDNTRGVSMIGAPTAWSAPDNVRGEGIKVAVIDSGIDYTHADFGGPGTTAAYEAAHASETAAADPALFGARAPKIKGGIDLVGDTYDADPASDTYQPVPKPDANPLDCGGHGTHVAGTIGGYGVLADGSTYRGAYDSTTINSKSWIIGPGVAPKVDLYAVRVFGCDGSTDMTVDAINWAVANDMDVINMSLGSPFGTADAPESVAADNASKNGVIVVASAGNSGPAPYITGSPAASTSTISVAASDPTPAFPGARLSLGLDAVNANGATFADGLTAPIKVIGNGAGGIALGCSTEEFAAAGAAGSIAVVARGTCARVAKAVYGQAAGAVAVIQVNNVDSLPPYEGPITSNPDTGEAANVTIPFLGVPSSAGATLLAANGSSLSLTNLDLENPGYKATASFSSGGARVGDSWLKPDVTAPGVSIFSAGVGAGTGTVAMSGTSMAAPMTAGQAALVKQAHPDWRKVEYWKAALVNTADPAGVADYTTRINGSGLIQAPGAVNTQVVALGDKGTSTLNYGFAELAQSYSKRKVVKVKNLSRTKQTFTVAATLPAGSPHRVKLSKTTVTLAGKGETEIGVTLQVAAGTAGDSSAFNDVAGLITLTPTGRSNDGVALRVPYYLVPQAVSKVSTKLDTGALKKKGSATATVTNSKGAVAGAADVFAWGLSDGRDAAGAADLKAVGVQSLPADNAIAFAISTHNRLSNAARNEFDVYVDVNGDKVDDYLVVGADYGLLTTGDLTGQLVTAVFDLRTGGATLEFFADAPFDGSTIVLPVLISQLCEAGSPCLSAANPRLTYHVASVGLIDGNNDTIAGTATFNAFTPALTTGLIGEVAPNRSLTSKITLNRAELATSPAKGLLVVSHDNTSATEAQLIPVK